ncbi:nucleotidyl transferase AbiEii/AbiGii toxin family protein [Sorangium sp. So ce381]|uniref:nucleotidyl transferase AbiEii/AbiGii toxin family protein n=1 Tax=Sorangium sp. So ce381 TaxID=3133307 RepID=UPI003F5B2DBD
MKLHRGILTAAQRKALDLLGPPATSRGLYLGGGTALALRLGHRSSIDFDWFSDAQLGDPLLLAEKLRIAGVPFATSMIAEGTLYGTVAGVQTSFLQYPYKRLRGLGKAREFSIASLDDLASMKLSAIVDRGSKKDFVDVFALCTKHRPLHELIGLYQQRFQTADVGHVLVALSYFDDAERTRMPRMYWDIDWKTIRRSVESWIRDAARRL